MRGASGTAVLGGLCVVALGVATNVATSVLPDGWRPYLWIAWPVLAVLVVLFVRLELRRVGEGGSAELPASSTQARTVLLERIHRHWVKGVLERSFYQQARIDLGLEATIDAVHPWDVVAAEPDQQPRLVPPGTRMRAVFNNLDKTMLVLGAPGSGKTTMLLELLQDLLAEASDRDKPVPLLLNLTSWTRRRETIEEWVIREVSELFQVSARHVRAWVAADDVVLLLDGLDEVDANYRGACVEAINDYRRAHGTVPIAAGCRSADYEELNEGLRMYGTLRIQPLSTDQVVDFLDRFGERAAGGRAALSRQPELHELMSTPLMLSILMLAFDSDTPVDIDGIDDSITLFQTFVTTMLRRRPSPAYTSTQTMANLAHLAANLKVANQTQFTFDLIDEFWLPFGDQRPKGWANLTCTTLGLAVLGGAGYVLLGWRGALVGGFTGLTFMLPAGQRLTTWVISSSQGRYRLFVSDQPLGWADWVFAVRQVAFAGLTDHPQVMTVAASVGVAAGALLGWTEGWWPAIAYAIGAAVPTIVAASLSYGFAYPIRKLPVRTYGPELPSPKLRIMLRIGLPVAALIGLVAAGAAWPILTLLTKANARSFALLVGIGAATYAATCLGLYAFVEQALTRLKLRRLGLFPLPARPLLDHATQCLFLHKVADSYLFSHQKLREFFEMRSTATELDMRGIEKWLGR